MRNRPQLNQDIVPSSGLPRDTIDVANMSLGPDLHGLDLCSDLSELTFVQVDVHTVPPPRPTTEVKIIDSVKKSNFINKPTQKSVADALGFSVSTVSRALAGDTKIAQTTRSVVKQKALELGYEPDQAATRLRTGKTNVISLVLPPHDELLDFGTSIIRGISTTLTGTEYYLVIRPDFSLDNGLTSIQRVVENNEADGLILSRTEPNDIRVRYLLENDFPFVTHGQTQLATPHAYVDFDNYHFAYSAVERLAKNDLTDVVILLPPKRLTFRHHLYYGFQQACYDFGVVGTILEGVDLDCPPEKIASAVKMEFNNLVSRRGLILPGDSSALAAMAVLSDLGLTINRDVYLVVKQTSGVFSYVRPLVPSTYEDVTTAGRLLAKFLLKRIKGADPGDLQLLLPISSDNNE